MHCVVLRRGARELGGLFDPIDGVTIVLVRTEVPFKEKKGSGADENELFRKGSGLLKVRPLVRQ